MSLVDSVGKTIRVSEIPAPGTVPDDFLVVFRGKFLGIDEGMIGVEVTYVSQPGHDDLPKQIWFNPRSPRFHALVVDG